MIACAYKNAILFKTNHLHCMHIRGAGGIAQQIIVNAILVRYANTHFLM